MERERERTENKIGRKEYKKRGERTRREAGIREAWREVGVAEPSGEIESGKRQDKERGNWGRERVHTWRRGEEEEEESGFHMK